MDWTFLMVLFVSLVLAVSLMAFIWLRPGKSSAKLSAHKPMRKREVVAYHSRRHGVRRGYLVGTDKSGRLIVQLFAHPRGVFMRRQPQLVTRLLGWAEA